MAKKSIWLKTIKILFLCLFGIILAISSSAESNLDKEKLATDHQFIIPTFNSTKEYEVYECKPRTAPGNRGGKVKDSPHFNFTWFSDADQVDNERFCYERLVTNRHKKSNLSYEWPIGRMGSIGLIPGEQDERLYIKGPPYNQALPGGLYYGRKNREASTEVWKANLEKEQEKLTKVSSYPALETVLKFVFENEGRVTRNFVILRSFVTSVESENGKKFRFNYMLENPGERCILTWVPGLLQWSKEDSESPPQKVITQKGTPALEVTGTSLIRHISNKPPVINAFRVNLFDPFTGKRMANGGADAYFPTR